MDEEKLAAGGPGSSRTGVKDLFSWKSLNRPMLSYSRDVFTTFAVIALLLSFIVAFIQEFLLIVVVWAAYFLFYALSKVPPVEVEHKITTEGVVSMDKSYLWSELGTFWWIFCRILRRRRNQQRTSWRIGLARNFLWKAW